MNAGMGKYGPILYCDPACNGKSVSVIYSANQNFGLISTYRSTTLLAAIKDILFDMNL